ncbi:hypothetical protein [Clostridium drakei]|nr:hypothetical protein [Clostridium drakei]
MKGKSYTKGLEEEILEKVEIAKKYIDQGYDAVFVFIEKTDNYIY